MSQLEKNIAFLTKRIANYRKLILSKYYLFSHRELKRQIRVDLRKAKFQRKELIYEQKHYAKQ